MSSYDLRSAFRSRRVALQLSQVAAGRLCTPPISQQTISELESGAANTQIDTAARYARAALRVHLGLIVDD